MKLNCLIIPKTKLATKDNQIIITLLPILQVKLKYYYYFKTIAKQFNVLKHNLAIVTYITVKGEIA